jgi:hypothetical protein
MLLEGFSKFGIKKQHLSKKGVTTTTTKPTTFLQFETT